MKNKKNQCQRLSNHYTAKSVGNTLETKYHQISFSASKNLRLVISRLKQGAGHFHLRLSTLEFQIIYGHLIE